MDSPTERQVTSLSDYVNENKDLLTIFGVFIAVAAFAGNLSIKIIAAFISIAAVTCAAFIAIEIWKRPIKGKSSLLLSFFRVALLLLTLSLLVYCFYFFDAIYPDISFPIITVILFEIVAWFLNRMDRHPLGKRIMDWIRRRAKFWKVVIVGILAILILFIARTITNKIDLPLFKVVVWIATVSSKIQGSVQ